MSELHPTADDVAVAIEAAARETGADPIDVASGQSGIRNGFEKSWEISRARNYAAWALHNVFKHCARPAIARMVGSHSPASLLPTIDFQLRTKGWKWWNAAAYDRVVTAIQRGIEGRRAQSAPVAEIGPAPELPAPQPAPGPPAVAEVKEPPEVLRQRDLGEMVFRRKPAKVFLDMTAELCGDPPPARSALADRGLPRERQRFAVGSNIPQDEDGQWARRRNVTLAEIGERIARMGEGVKD